MKKIILLFFIFSISLFAKWEVGALHTDNGETATTFTTYDAKTESDLIISVILENADGYSSVSINNKEIKKGDNLILTIRDRAGNPVNYNIFNEDVRNGGVFIMDKASNRGERLIKMLLSGKSAKLYNNGELSASFNLDGIKKFMRKNLGFSDWYKYKLRNRERK